MEKNTTYFLVMSVWHIFDSLPHSWNKTSIFRVNGKGTNSSWGILIDVSLNTYVDIVSFGPPKSEDGQIKKGDDEGKRPDSGIDDKSSRSPKRSSELNPSWSKGGEEIV